MAVTGANRSATWSAGCGVAGVYLRLWPAYVTGKELSPSALEVNKRYYLNAHLEALGNGQASELNLLDYAISESAVWACTACGACINICPVGNEPMFDILYLRRHQVLM